MKKWIIGVLFATVLLGMVVMDIAQADMTYTMDNKPTAWWGTGGTKDTLWNWAKEVETYVEANLEVKGSIYYVDSGVSSEGDGTSWTNAKDTLNEAINLCTADDGDVIYIAPGHTETMGAAADEVDVDIAGITIIGLGTGEVRPLFDYTGDVTGAFAIGADDVRIHNLQFLANVPDVNQAIEIETGAENFVLTGLHFNVVTAGTDEFLDVITIAANCDNGVIDNCVFEMAGGASQSAINGAGTDYLQISNCRAFGDYGVACIEDATTASVMVSILNNVLFNGTTGGNAGLGDLPVISMKADTTGVIAGNHCICDTTTPEGSIVAADMFLVGNTFSETEGGVPVPPMWVAGDVAGNILGFDDNDNSYASTNVAANADGSIIERLEQIDVDTSAIIADTAAIQPYQEMYISSADVNIADGSVAGVFTIGTAPILVTSLSFQFTEAASNTSVTFAFEADPTTGAGDLNIASAVDVDNTAIGGWVYAEGDGSAAVISAIAGNVAQGCTVPFVCPIGEIDITMGSANLTTGIGTVWMSYKPLGAAVVAAP